MGGDGVAVDGSLIKADASRQKGVEGAHGFPTADQEPKKNDTSGAKPCRTWASPAICPPRPA